MTEVPETLVVDYNGNGTASVISEVPVILGTVKYTRVRPVTVAEAAKVLLDAGIERDLAKSMAHFISVKEWEGYKRGVKAYTSTLRALSHEGGE